MFAQTKNSPQKLPYSYTLTFIEARNSLVSLCDKWEKEDESMINSVDCIKVQLNSLFQIKLLTV